MTDRRSSAARFDKLPQGRRLGALGTVICVLLLPLAIVASRTREAPIVISQRGTVRLPDGSYAGLSHGATIKYSRDFSRRRVLWLHGSVSLEVVPGAPFTVWTETGVAKTSSASLAIEASGLESTFVLVRRGVVRLRAMNEDQDPAYPPVTIAEGQRAFAARMVGARLVVGAKAR